MNEEKSPYAQYYSEGYQAGLHSKPSSSCPYQPVAGPQRREQLTKRMAWLEGHVDGDRERLRIVTAGRDSADKKSARKLPPADTKAVRSVVQRRYQRRQLRESGGRERYVDRRLRQINEERAQQVTCAKSET